MTVRSDRPDPASARAAEIAHRIRRMRERLNLSKSELGELVGLSRDAVREIEAGTRRILATEAIEFAYALDVSPVWLLGLMPRRTEMRYR